MPTDLTKPELQRLRGRDWSALREAWLSYVPSFPTAGSLLEQSSEDLLQTKGFKAPTEVTRLEQIVGVRSSVLWEATTLFQKSHHVRTAARQLASAGMETWSLFNHYHSAYLAAKGVMYLLGVTSPTTYDRQCLLDVFAAPEDDKSGKKIKVDALTDFLAIPLAGPLDQHQMWGWFGRTLSSTRSAPWDGRLARDIFLIDPSRLIPRQRNRLLYRPSFWIANDLVRFSESTTTPVPRYGLDTDSPNFLLALSEHVNEIFEVLLAHLSEFSVPIRAQMTAAKDLSLPE